MVPVVPLRVDPTVSLDAGFEAIRTELGVTAAFPAEVEAEAAEVVRRGPSSIATVDLRDVPFVTIDPPGSMDLDQALHLSRSSGGYVFRYAIADLAAFVTPGGTIDAEARRRAVTVYLPDANAPLHPRSLSEGAASLLPDGERQAMVWTITLDREGAPTDVRTERARVRSRARFTYSEASELLENGTAEEPLLLLQEVGRLREEAEAERGGVSLPIPDQQVVEIEGRYRLEFRAPLAVEGWNAQLSLLTGLCAGEIMVDGRTGILRTLPAPDDATVETLRRHAAALGVAWPADTGYGDFIRSLEPANPAEAALVAQAARLFRGAGYLGFNGSVPDAAEATHAAVAGHYAHVTAPLRRLVDRFGNAIVLALGSGDDPPAWATEALEELPALMQAGRHREAAASGMALDLVEAAVLSGRIGEVLSGVVTDAGGQRTRVQVVDPAIVVTIEESGLQLGQEVRLRVAGADVPRRRVDLHLA